MQSRQLLVGALCAAIATITVSTPASAAAANPLAGMRFAADPGNQANSVAASLWSQGRNYEAGIVSKLAATPTAVWLGGWSSVWDTVSAREATATAQGTVPVFVAYNIPHRDCGSYSAGGASDAGAYKNFVDTMSAAIGNRRAVVIVEPDALANLDCLSSAQQNERYQLLSFAVNALRKNSTYVYLDAGHSNWKTVPVMVDRLNRAGIAKANGFSLNVSSYNSIGDTASYGNQISQRVGKNYVVDTSRNGKGADGANWCNPSNRKIGSYPTSNTGRSMTDAFLWIKNPGESDGNCNGGPSAGQYWADRAVSLAK